MLLKLNREFECTQKQYWVQVFRVESLATGTQLMPGLEDLSLRVVCNN